jgi:nicotinate-nucleotide diphosphorylase (carboxylating)
MDFNVPYSPLVDRIIELALQEDLGTGDLATNALILITSSTRGEATLVAKSNGIVSGLGVAARVFWVLDSSIMLVRCLNDGDPVVQGMEIARIRGSYRSLLSGERTALNFLQRMCGIATLTRQYVSKLEGYKTRLLDTRKTAPGLRILDKLAVLHGGGSNHRMGLYDLAMIKDNHIAIAGGIAPAVQTVRASIPVYTRVEVEAENLDMVQEALQAQADIIMLDNMPIDTMAQAVELIAGRALTEASGNVTVEQVRAIAETGVDFISVGAITHSAQALDISMRIKLIR